MLGVQSFDRLVNQIKPLFLGLAQLLKPVVVNGEIVARPIMSLRSFIDDGYWCQIMKRLEALIEDPIMLV